MCIDCFRRHFAKLMQIHMYRATCEGFVTKQMLFRSIYLCVLKFWQLSTQHNLSINWPACSSKLSHVCICSCMRAKWSICLANNCATFEFCCGIMYLSHFRTFIGFCMCARSLFILQLLLLLFASQQYTHTCSHSHDYSLLPKQKAYWTKRDKRL